MPNGLRSGPLGDPGAQLDRRETALDRVRGAEVAPVLGRERVERGELLPVAVELGDRLRVLGFERPGSSRAPAGRHWRSVPPSSRAAALSPWAAGVWGARRGRWRS